MKKALLSLLALATFGLYSCSKSSDSSQQTSSYKCTACATTPDAKAAYDNSSKGIYKGIVVGSSGTIKFDIGNGDSTITAHMVIDGIAVDLTASVSWVAGQSYVAPFTGTMNGSPVTITFSVDATGANPTITSANIPGHPNAVLTVAKESSTDLLESFEGTIKNNTTGETGTMDMLVSSALKKWHAVIRTTGSSSPSEIDGTISGNTFNFNDGSGSVATGTRVGDQINGTWSNTKSENGTWTAKRTL